MSKVDQEIKVEPPAYDDPMGGFRYSHPCFGMISISHGQGNFGTRLFGSEVDSNRHSTITISECEVRQDLGRNWYHSKQEITEVILTPIQFSEFVSSPNQGGVPCTIRYRCDVGHIGIKNIDTVTTFAKTELDKTGERIKQSSKEISQRVKEILNKKGALNRSDKDAVIRLVAKLSQDISSNFEFHEKNVHESIYAMVSEAKSDIDSHITHAINKIGIDTLKSPEAMRFLLESKKD
jgi:hypothetical protein|tara:strand:- start:466 stop:1173 length:708 start_codon:yes stop_codon:yes gene_type:complete